MLCVLKGRGACIRERVAVCHRSKILNRFAWLDREHDWCRKIEEIWEVESLNHKSVVLIICLK